MKICFIANKFIKPITFTFEIHNVKVRYVYNWIKYKITFSELLAMLAGKNCPVMTFMS